MDVRSPRVCSVTASYVPQRLADPSRRASVQPPYVAHGHVLITKLAAWLQGLPPSQKTLTGTIPHVWVGPVPLLVAKSDNNNYLTVLSTIDHYRVLRLRACLRAATRSA
eukprot:5968789-Prymnesium_polylepis.2